MLKCVQTSIFLGENGGCMGELNLEKVVGGVFERAHSFRRCGGCLLEMECAFSATISFHAFRFMFEWTRP